MSAPAPALFHTLLVANRGEIARRVMRSAHDLGLRCVAVYAPADAEAPHVAEADEAVRLGQGYLDGAAILEAARATGAGAIHPGYGFLAENAAFAADVAGAGIAWVGPSAEAIARMGDKLAAKALAEEAGVPTLPGSDDPTAGDAVGYPLLVKAAAGGGGKGMRVVESARDLDEAVAAARREARGAFGDERVFLERFVGRARHVEIQILGDAHGGLVHLGERECSIQRRHQKILEESPSPRVDPALRESMGEAALRLARALDYRSAGTVEFLLDDATGEFFFLEVNTRLQVEHPVTEAVTGVDLVREQLRVARGETLGFAQGDVRFAGAAIEARLYAEDPAADFLPATGALVAFDPPASPAVRWDAGVVAGSVIRTDFDPMLAKVIAHGATRDEAAARLALALERCHLGGVTTNRDFLVAVLRAPAFLAGDTTTDFIERVRPARRLEPGPAELERAARVAALWLQGESRTAASALAASPSGWRNARMPDQEVRLAHGEAELAVRYRRLRDGRFRFAGGEHARIHAWSPRAIDTEIDGRRRRARVTRAGERLVVQTAAGDLELAVRPRFEPPGGEETAGGFVAAMPGKVLELRVKAGDRVRAGDTLVVLEAMKMEHPMRAGADGVVVEVRVSQGDQVESGTVLLVVEPEADAADAGEGRVVMAENAEPGTAPIRIANCSGFFGDRLSAAREMVEGGPIDVLTGDWLAELTMLILARTRLKRPGGGYARTFVTQMEQVMGTCLDRGIKVVANAGGLDPDGCAAAVAEVAERLGLHPKIAFVRGDDLMPRMAELVEAGQLRHFETGEPIKDASAFLTANAYLGCWGIVEALALGADIVITGRCTDAAVVCGPAAWHHGWSRSDWDALAGAVAAGHVIECGTQATGGNYAFFTEVPGMERVGFPWAEVSADGSSVIGKHDGTGGEVSPGTVTSQLLYEIGGPRYLGPDVTTRFDTIRLESAGPDRVRLHGVRGEPPPDTLKVCINRAGGFRNDMSVCLTGLDIEAKAELVERAFWSACPHAPEDFAQVTTRLIRSDQPDPETNEQAVAIWKLSVKDPDEKKVGRAFSNAVIELALATIPGFFGVGGGPGPGRPFGVYEPACVPAEAVPQEVVLFGGETREVSSAIPPADVSVEPAPGPSTRAPSGPTRRAPLGAIFGARSGDKGGDANLGVFARSDEAWAWLDAFLDLERLRELLPEVAPLAVDRHRLPSLRSLNFVIHGLLEEGVAASTRQDPQAKSLGEWLRARVVELPEALLP